MSISSLIRKAKRKLNVFDVRPSDDFSAALKGIGSGEVCLDCGANVGVYTILMAKTGATVHAFEPDPNAFEVLQRRTKAFPNVHLHKAAVSSTDGTAELFFHRDGREDPVHFSQGSSLLKEKENLGDQSVTVPTIELNKFIEELGAPVSLLKMDIEGAEIEVLNSMIDRGGINKVQKAFIELHDRKNKGLRAATDGLRARIAPYGDRFDLTWH